MTKKQKIWMWVFLAMFILPEVFWSPVSNFLYSFFMPTIHGSSQILRNNFLLNSDNQSLLLFCLLVQTIGTIGILFLIYKISLSFKKKLFLISITLIILIPTVFSLFIAFALRNCCGF